jgi:hypothetical protein
MVLSVGKNLFTLKPEAVYQSLLKRTLQDGRVLSGMGGKAEPGIPATEVLVTQKVASTSRLF